VHYLSNHDEARLVRLFEGLRGTRPVEVVMREVFPPDEARRLEGEVTAYLGAAKFRGYQTSLRRVPTLSAVRTLEPWQVHQLRSRLFLRDEKAAENDQRLALELAPTPRPAALAVLDAELAKRPISSLLPDYPEAPEVLAELEEEDAPAHREAFERAVLAAPDEAPLRLAAAKAASGAGDTAAAERHAMAGLALAPWSVELAGVLLSVSVAQGRCDEAIVRLARLEALLPERPSKATKEWAEAFSDKVRQCAEATR
jgi:hypothetical protein